MTTALPLTIDPALLEALGRIVTEFNALEMYVSMNIWALLGVTDQEIAQLVTAKLLFNAKLELFRALHHHREPKQVASVDRLVKRLETIGTTRNELVHGIWSIANPPGESHTVNMRRKGTPSTKRTIASLQSATSDIQQLGRELLKMFFDRVPPPKS